jgi:hypothetical protein
LQNRLHRSRKIFSAFQSGTNYRAATAAGQVKMSNDFGSLQLRAYSGKKFSLREKSTSHPIDDSPPIASPAALQ